MKSFFISNLKDNEALEIYISTKKKYQEKGYNISDKKIFGFSFYEGIEEKRYFVGNVLEDTSEEIYIIFYDEGKSMYLVLTPSFGVYYNIVRTFTKGVYGLDVKEYLFE